MRQRVGSIVKVLAATCLLACAVGRASAQDESDLTAKQRVFPGVGPGLRAVKRGADGRLYVLASPSPGLVVFDAQGILPKTATPMPTARSTWRIAARISFRYLPQTAHLFVRFL